MKKMHFEIAIAAKPEKVWKAITDDKNYREWAKVFYKGSYFEGGWDKGDTIRFLALNKKGQKEGMVSVIAESNKYSYISIKHLGYVTNGVEDTTSDEVKKWAPAYENYTLIPSGQTTTFEVDIDVEEQYAQMFNETWPKALKLLKKIAEKTI